MRRRSLSPTAVNAASSRGPLWIGLGLTLLAAAVVSPAVPAVTAMALVTLGATCTTLGRFRDHSAFVPVLLIHAAVYGGIYALFVGATLHAASIRPGTFMGLLVGIDLATSVVPLAAAALCVWSRLATRSNSQR